MAVAYWLSVPLWWKQIVFLNWYWLLISWHFLSPKRKFYFNVDKKGFSFRDFVPRHLTEAPPLYPAGGWDRRLCLRLALLQNINLLSVDVTTEHSLIRTTAVAGSVVTFNCTLDVDCFTQPHRWEKYVPSSDQPKNWYVGQVAPKLNSSGVSVTNDLPRGWSVLSISPVRLGDRGRFRCYVPGWDVQKCQMNFQLRITGKNWLDNFHFESYFVKNDSGL